MTVQIAYARRPLARKPVSARLNRLGENQFEGYASLFNTSDGAGDSVAPGAFASSLRKRGPGGIRIVLPIVLLLYFTCDLVGCDQFQHKLASSSLGDTVVFHEEYCSGFGASAFHWISLVEARGGNRGVIAAYEPEYGFLKSTKGVEQEWNTGAPKARWLNDTTVLIEIKDVPRF